MFSIRKSVEVKTHFDPTDIGTSIAYASTEEQAEILNAIAKGFADFPNGHQGQEYQMLGIAEYLTLQAKEWFCHFDSVLDQSEDERKDKEKRIKALIERSQADDNT